MHDCLEYTLQYEVKELLNYFVHSHIITLNELNSTIESFEYSGTDAGDKPTPISTTNLSSKDHSLKETGNIYLDMKCDLLITFLAVQMWCLGRLLPLMIGEKVPEDDENWQNYLLMLSIVDYIFAPRILPECLSELKILIRDHHQKFTELYPSSPITPKLHYMVHYPECREVKLLKLNMCNVHVHIIDMDQW